MTAPIWPDWIENVLWAKSPEKGKAGQAESLAQHTWYVLEKLAEAIRLRPSLPAILGLPNLWNMLFWACFLHDFGKAAVGFQARLRGGPKWPHRHEVLSLLFLDWIADALSQDELQWVTAAIVSHHKDASEIQRMYMDPIDPEDDPLIAPIGDITHEALGGLWRWLEACPASWIEALDLGSEHIKVPTLPQQSDAIRHVQEKGVLRVRDLLRGYRSWLITLNHSSDQSLVIGTLALRGNLVSADHIASAHIKDTPIPSISLPINLLGRLGIEESKLYTHQKTCITTRGSAVLIAPTGSGKTESALLWACAQSSGNSTVPRLFYTLPYQASMNAMYARLNEKAFPAQVGLEHSRSALAIYRHFLSEDYSPQLASEAARWSKNLAMLNYFPVRVLSPYQILKAPYRLKGYEELLSDFFDAAFVFDEIHVYDTPRLSTILGIVKYLREHFRTRFFIMSATLPSILRQRLSEALGEYALIQASPALFAQFRRHELHLIDDDLVTEHWASKIVEIAKSRQSVLVCCNTVKSAQSMYGNIKNRLKDADVILLHGRYNSKDRLKKESAIQTATGSKSRKRQPIVLVATQVVEVSLDIDLDVIYTEPAPLEALIQRFGRINRSHRKERAPVYVFTKPRDGQGVYSDILVDAALTVLSKNVDRMIDESQISEWLDEVYQGQIFERWNREYENSYAEFEGACLSTLRAFNSEPSLEEAFYQAFDGIEVLPKCLEKTYRVLMEQGEPLEANQLVVSLSWKQFCMLRREGRVQDEKKLNWHTVVDTPYTDLGLEV